MKNVIIMAGRPAPTPAELGWRPKKKASGEIDMRDVSLEHQSPWQPPLAPVRPDGFECLIWHRGRWRHVRWSDGGWMFGYASAHTLDTPDRLYAPLPASTPDHDFWQGEKS